MAAREAQSSTYSPGYIVPLPRQMDFRGFDISLDSDWIIITNTSDPEYAFIADWLRNKTRENTSGEVDMQIADFGFSPSPSSRIIYIGAVPEGQEGGPMSDAMACRGMSLPTFEEFGQQGYLLKVFRADDSVAEGCTQRDEAVIAAKSAQGAFYGATSFVQMPNSTTSIHAVDILDFPHFSRRNTYPNFYCMACMHVNPVLLYENTTNKTDWLASMKYNYISMMYPADMRYLYNSQNSYPRVYYPRYAQFIKQRFISNIPGVGQFKHALWYRQYDSMPRRLELYENYYTQDERFTFDQLDIAMANVPYANVLPASNIDGDFETLVGSPPSPQGWEVRPPQNSMAWSVDTVQSQSGSKSMRLDIGQDASGYSPDLITTASNIVPSSHYIITYWYKTQDFATSNFFQAFAYTKIGGNFETGDARQHWFNAANTNGWKKGFILIMTTPASDRIQLYMRVAGGISGTLWIDNVTIRRLDGAMLNVVRQPDFPQHDIVVTNLDETVTYQEGVDYSITNGLLSSISPMFDPDGELNAANPGPEITPFEIHRIAGGGIEPGAEVLVNYNSYYVFDNGISGLATYKMVPFGDPRIWDMNESHQYHSDFYIDSFKGIYYNYSNESRVNGTKPEFISILGDEQRGLYTDSRSINSGASMQQLEANMVNNISEFAKSFDENVTILMYSDMVDPYFTGGIEKNQLQYGGPYGRMADATGQNLLSQDVALMHWTELISNVYRSLNYFIEKGYPPTLDIWGTYNKPSMTANLVQIMAAQQRKVPLITIAMANMGGATFPAAWDSRAADYFWNPRYMTTFVESWETDGSGTPPGWVASDAGFVHFACSNVSPYCDGKVHQTNDGLFNNRSIGLNGPGAFIMQDDYLNVTQNREYALAGYARLRGSSTPLTSPHATLTWYAADGSEISDSTLEITDINAAGFAQFELDAIAPTGAKKAKITLRGSDSNEWYYFDNIMFKESISLQYNHPPIFEHSTILLAAGSSVETILATDPDGDGLLFNATGLPEGATLLPDGTFSWTPTELDIGSYEFEVSARDKLFTERRTIYAIVAPEPQPDLLASVSAGVEGGHYVGVPFPVIVDTYNLGSGETAAPSTTRVFWNDTVAANIQIQNLQPLRHNHTQIELNCANEGEFLLNLTADANGDIEEFDELNNNWSRSIWCEYPPMPILSVTSPYAGDVYRNELDILGSIGLPEGVSYAVEYSNAGLDDWSSEGVSLENDGKYSVTNGKLATFTFTAPEILDSQFYKLRVVARMGYRNTPIYDNTFAVVGMDGGLELGTPLRVSIPRINYGEFSNYDFEGYPLVPVVKDVDSDFVKEVGFARHNESGNGSAIYVAYAVPLTPGSYWQVRTINSPQDTHWKVNKLSLLANDFNNDGTQDFAYNKLDDTPAGSVRAVAQQLDGTEIWTRNYPQSPFSPNSYNSFSVSADLNRDGRKETVSIMLQQGAKRLYVTDADGNEIHSWALNQLCYVYTYMQSPIVGNFDNDPELEIAYAGDSQHLCNLEQPGGIAAIFDLDGTDRSVEFNSERPAASPASADLNNDGMDELIIASGALRVYGPGLTPVWERLAGSNFKGQPAIGDIDNDGQPEIVVKEIPQQTGPVLIHIFRSNGDEIMGGWPANDASQGPFGALLADVDGNGQLDILYEGNASIGGAMFSTIHARNLQGTELVGFPKYTERVEAAGISAVDIDNDGLLELLSSSDGFRQRLWTSNQNIGQDEAQNTVPRQSIYLWRLGVPDSPINRAWPVQQHSFDRTGRYVSKLTSPFNFQANAGTDGITATWVEADDYYGLSGYAAQICHLAPNCAGGITNLPLGQTDYTFATPYGLYYVRVGSRAGELENIAWTQYRQLCFSSDPQHVPPECASGGRDLHQAGIKNTNINIGVVSVSANGNNTIDPNGVAEAIQANIGTINGDG
jgi:hypothetical protein